MNLNRSYDPKIHDILFTYMYIAIQTLINGFNLGGVL